MELVEQKQFAVAAYKTFYEQLEEFEKSNTAIIFDYESTKGNKEARSHVYKLRQSKASLEKVRKDEKAESDKLAALKLAEDNRLKAIQDEKDRAEKERKDAEAEQAKREANKTHRATINRAALASLVAGGIDESIAKECISLIAKGFVDNVTINY